MKLRKKVTVITGGGGGIGLGICREFLREGARVAICEISKEKAEQAIIELQSNKLKCLAVEMDVSNLDNVEKAATEIQNKFGKIDIWVNCAGVSYIVPFLDCSEAIWDKTIAVNLKGTYNGCKAAVKRMIEFNKGVIINISSQSGKKGNEQYAAYCASKFGIIGLTQSLALEFAKNNIRVNALCPGIVFTPLWDSMIEDYAAKRNIEAKDVKSYFEERIPLGRICKVEDVARAAVYLASDDASYITGQSINITGGTIMH